MSQVDEGLIHAWLDGQLPADEAARIERLVATDADWGAAAADARGVVAGASRILGALDDVPSVRQPGSVGAATRVRRSVWRAPWLRAAAGIALVAGVGSVLFRERPGDQNVDATIAKEETGDKVRGAPVEVASPPPGVTGGLKATAPEQQTRSPQVATAREPGRRDTTAGPRAESRLDAQKVVGATGMAASGAASATAGAGAAVATTQNILIDSLRGSAQGLQKSAPAAASADAGRAGAGGGRGSLAGFGASPLNAAAAPARQQTTAESLAERQIIDRRISGCWLVIDSVPSRAYVINFVDPAVTDVLRASAKSLVQGGAMAAPMAPPRELSLAPAGARVQHATPRMISADSTFSAEWFTDNEGTTLLFTVRGDTLVGTMRRAAPRDIAYPIAAVRAARVQCPR